MVALMMFENDIVAMQSFECNSTYKTKEDWYMSQKKKSI